MASADEQVKGDDAAGAAASVADVRELRQRSKPQKKPGTDAEEDNEAGRSPPGACCEVTDSIERVFESEPVPPWREQVTVRALVTSLFLAVLFSVIVMKLSLTTGIIPSLNVSAGLLGFFLLRVWTAAVKDPKRPFTRQENTVVQTCVVAAYGIAFSGTIRSMRRAPADADLLPARSELTLK